ncbi:tyrosinase [Methylobacterium terrae]|uniref:Tyrosinase n=2 Tax=Methylobacterium terrae TaxID=2202827 RepID=A0A2U8WUL3_9HYPH|nr:tyrosinase [Methylobacterium terrae]
MKKRPLDDPTSWRFYGGIHGFNAQLWKQLGLLSDNDKLPDAKTRTLFWDQCQHQTWYFLPWHRGYLWAFETVVRDAVVSLGGPADWTLPYWNYFAKGQSALPPAFASRNWTGGDGDNPLFVPQRYGPAGDGKVFIPLDQVNLLALNDREFTGEAGGGSPGFGGVDTGFSHGGSVNGGVESQPHNIVHVLIGGVLRGTRQPGLMSVPSTAGLDPIFWLHHANIDRLWQVWRGRAPGHVDPTVANWVDGPADRSFVMPLPGKRNWTFAPGQTESTVELGYEYDDVSGGEVLMAALHPALRAQAATAGVAQANASQASPLQASLPQGSPAMTSGKNVELVGASQSAIKVVGQSAQAAVTLAPDARQRVSANLAASAPGTVSAQNAAAAPPERVLLNLENVRGLLDGVAFQVYVGPQGSDPSGKSEALAGSVGLFGVSQATERDGPHGGSGLTFVLDITPIVEALHASRDLDADKLDVRIVPLQPVPAEAQISIGRVSVFRQGR